jgi:hypothetical protein
MLMLSIVSPIIIFKGKIFSEESLNSTRAPDHINIYMMPTIEYTPIWVNNIKEIISEEKHDKVSVVSGVAEHNVIEWKSEKRVASIRASTPALVRISTFYYPGWKAIIDDRNTPIMIEKNTGSMLVEIPEGDHILTLRFEDTMLRRLSKVISLLSLFIVIFLIVMSLKKNPVKMLSGN